ncbi:MAG: anhydro-N-acetylmuramic acid kinase [Methylotenera sp.]
MSKAQLFIGIMSGTSLDGVDAALVAFENDKCTLQNTQFLPYPEELKLALLSLHKPQNNELEASCILGCRLAHLYAETTKALLKTVKVNAAEISAIGCHGQTIRHRPELGFTLQIGNNALLAELTNITVVGDFRSRDIAAGGQGAPLVPAFHQAMFTSKNKSADKQKNRAIVNIGGIANITYLGKNGDVLGFDSGPGNMLIDSWTKLKTGKDYDTNGAWAATGVVIESLLTNMLAEPYFALPPPKSTGRDLFNDDWLKQRQLYPHLRPQDVARTLTALTAQSICDALSKCGEVDEVYLCGGGAHNQLLFDDLQANIHAASGAAVLSTTKALGIDVDWVEAVAFAWLAKQCLENKPSNLPAVTGAKSLRVLGAIYPA